MSEPIEPEFNEFGQTMAQGEADYQRGVQDARNWQENKRMFGDEMAERMEMEREMRTMGEE